MGSDVAFLWSQYVRCSWEAPQTTSLEGVSVEASGRNCTTAAAATLTAMATPSGSHSRSRGRKGRDRPGGTVGGTGTGDLDSRPIRRDSDRDDGRRMVWAATNWALEGVAV